MFNRKYFLISIASYILLRVFSFYFSPATPLYAANPLNSIVSGALLIAVIYLLYTKNIWGWYLIAFEIILGGSGGYLGVHGTSLRTLLLVTSLTIYLYTLIKEKKIGTLYSNNKQIFILIAVVVGYATIAALSGIIHHHAFSAVKADVIPYLFLLYYFPLAELLKQKQVDITLLYTGLLSAIIGNALLIAGTFAGFSNGLLILQDSYYHWYRDVALGKITELPFHFYRLVLNEQLLLIPLAAYFVSKTIGSKKIFSANFGIVVILLAILSVNLTRSYMLALAVVFITLFQFNNWKRWLIVTASSALVFIAIFTGVHIVASRGQSLGWELFGLRLQSIASPQIEESSLSRLLLLPKIIDKIKAHPIIGEGLGATVTVYSPVFKQTITTPHFDWGYLEIIAEMGIIGLILWGWLVVYLIRLHIYSVRWIIGSIAALLVINLTAPALFHVMGIIWFTVLFAYPQKYISELSFRATSEESLSL